MSRVSGFPHDLENIEFENNLENQEVLKLFPESRKNSENFKNLSKTKEKSG